MDFKLESSGEGFVSLDGELTIEHAAELKALLIRALESADRVYIRLKDVTAVDLSCLQLLCSAHRSAVKIKKHITLERGNCGVFEQTLKDAGFCRSRDCQKDPYGNCFWTGGEQS